MAAEIIKYCPSSFVKDGKATMEVEKFISVGYCGAQTIDQRYVPPVLHWVALEIVRKHKSLRHATVHLTTTNIELHNSLHEGLKISQYSLDTVCRLSRLKNCGLDNYMGFITIGNGEVTECKLHVLKFDSSEMKNGFLHSLKTKVLGLKHNSHLIHDETRRASLSLIPPKPTHRRGVSSGAIFLSPGSTGAVFRDSVYYIGKVTISRPQAPPKFIDNVLIQLKRINVQDAEKKQKRERRTSDIVVDESKSQELEIISRGRSASCNSDTRSSKELFLPSDTKDVESSEIRDDSSVTLSNIQKEVQSRLVTLSISKTSLMLFSVGSKNLLLEKKIKNISFCAKGETRCDHFGFICCESGNNVCYIFQGESESKVDAIMKAMKLAFSEALEASAHLTLCDTCPLQYFHKLCTELETVTTTSERDEILQEFIRFLSDYETLHIINSVNEAGAKNENERISVTVEVLRKFFDEKQKTHKHSKVQTQLNVENNDLERPRSSTIFEKAKKSLTSSFQSLTTKKSSNIKLNNPSLNRIKTVEGLVKPRSKSYESPNSCPATPDFSSHRLEFNLEAGKKSRGGSIDEEETREIESKDIVGDVKEFETYKEMNNRRGSWRQAIYHSVTTASRKGSCTSITTVPGEFEEKPANLDPHQHARERWKSAILNQILLIRMEKENKKLAAKISATELRRQKLSYQDLCLYSAEAASMWDELLSRQHNERIDDQVLLAAVRGGVPRMRRGEIWQFLIKQFTIRAPRRTDGDNWNTSSYKSNLAASTSHQHAILIDLGRTFPTHAHFIPRLGSGQLCLFNVLKAYSVLDEEVGYCQGLSFVAGLLLMHMTEEETYNCFCHLMFGLQIRNQYKPDMNAVQQQLYQLSRLLHDYHPSVYEHFNTFDVTPTLYAAPWFLTLFASHYPIGFVSRVMDLVLLQGMEVIFKVALVLVGNHLHEILARDSFENIVEYMKSSLPERVLVGNATDDICTRALNMDIKYQLNLYEVEYQLLKEEMIDIRQNRERLEKEMVAHKVLENEVLTLRKELQIAKCAIDDLKQTLNDTCDAKLLLEKQCSVLSKERDDLSKKLKREELNSINGVCTGKVTTRHADSVLNTVNKRQAGNLKTPILQVNGESLVNSK